MSENSAASTGFADVLASPGRMALFQGLFLALVAAVVIRGVQKGIEWAMKVLMPVMALLLVALTVYSLRNGDASAAFRFLFVPEFDDLTARGVLDALGLGFFSIGVGLGILLTYAAYSPPQADLKKVAVISVAADTVISFMAGLAVFPIVFANDLDAGSGPGLVFETLPVAFETMPGGRPVAVSFFALLTVAALGSAVSMLEAVVAVLDRRFGWSRAQSVVVSAATCFVAGLATVFSFNEWSGFHPFSWMERYSEATVYDLLDDATSQLMLPAGGLAIAAFTGWVLSDRLLGRELRLGGLALTGLRWVLRVVAPATILAAVCVSLFG